jgi:phosphoribosylanthranilate isomerase
MRRAMPTPAKICGVSTPEAVAAALAGKAAYLGFVFFPKSPRHILPEPAARLAEPVRGHAKIVALMVDPSNNEVDEVARAFRPDLIQLHGKETPARVREIGERVQTGIIKALSVETADDVAAGEAYSPVVEHLMFDAKAPKDAARPGGHGAAFDWSLLTGRRFPRPWFLAGGLDPWNVGEAIAQSGAPMVDVSSGVERGPGLKDPALITAFLDAARRA